MLQLTESVSKTFGNLVHQKGDLLGVEVELEGTSPFPYDVAGWYDTRDGSLKSDYSVEYVLDQPSTNKECFKSIDTLFETIENMGTCVSDTGRAGIHVHLNVGDLTNKQLWTLITCWFVIEELVTDTMSGEGRSGNHFCLRAIDAEVLLDNIQDYLTTGDTMYISTDRIRYSALNLCSLRKFGTLEFRAMRSTTKVRKIKRWLNVLMRVKKSSLEFNNPQEVVSGFSFLEEDVFLDKILGGRYAEVAKRDPEYKEKLYRGVRVAQEVAYSIGDWDRKDPDHKNPFADIKIDEPWDRN